MPKFAAPFLAILGFSLSLQSHATEIPKALDDWRGWVLDKHPDIHCPIELDNGTRNCRWPSELILDANDKGATFSQRVDMYMNDWVALPGNANIWPETVTDNGNTLSIRDHDGTPEVFLTVGSHQINGHLNWLEMPRSIALPDATGIVKLNLKGKSVQNPTIDEQQLWLENSEPQTTQAHQDNFEVHVYRKLTDDIPLQLTTQLQLNISGKEREITLGQLLIDGFTPTEFTSELPARIEKDGSLKIQAKAGTWEINLKSHSLAPTKSLTFKASNDLWPQEEVWVFEANRKLRSVQISGVQALDPKQTQLPDDWKSLPAYLVTPKMQLTIEELHRGENTDTANKIIISRQAWLSFDGSHFLFRDNLTGEFHGSRLEIQKPFKLTSASINNEPQLVTQLTANSDAGIEIRNHTLNVTAVNESPTLLTTPLVGWKADIHQLDTQLHLPPGWSLLTATGTSSEYGSWLSRWNLWDMFAVLIIVVAFARLTSPLLAATLALSIILTYQREGAPIFIWLVLTSCIALTKFVSGAFKQWIMRFTYVSFISLAIITLPFAIKEARILINPSLENEDFWVVSSSFMFTGDSKKKAAPAPMLAAAPIADAIANEPESVEEVVVTGAKAERMKKLAERIPEANNSPALQRMSGIKFEKRYDPTQQTQTGLALPNFNQKSVYLHWEGPIKKEETTRLVLLPPWINAIGHLLAIVCPLFIALVLMLRFLDINKMTPPSLKLPKIFMGSFHAFFIVTAALFITPHDANADVTIDANLIKELESRLTEAPKCLPNCASIESVALDINQDLMKLEIVAHASELIALPLPADHAQWWPQQVTVDGKSALLAQSSQQELLVSLPKGRHSITINANLQGRDQITLSFPLNIHNLRSTISGWDLSGAPTKETQSESLSLQRIEQAANTKNIERLHPDPIPAFVMVNRRLNIDLDWSVTTTVSRVAPITGTINLEIPLIAGESPLTTKQTEDGKVAVHLEMNQESFEWTSHLNQVTPLVLEAPAHNAWAEVWSMDISPRWHADAQGLPAVQADQQQSIPVWQPWPSEKLTINLQKPQAVKGQHITIDNAHVNYTPGNHSSNTRLELTLRANQGDQYSFALPAGAQLNKVMIDNQEQIINATQGKLKLPLHPGSQQITLDWSQDENLGIFTHSPAIQLDGGSANQTINIVLPANRWILWVGGPQIGPSVLAWGMLLVMSIVAFGLGRAKLTPLKTYEWILLSLGICTLSMWTFVLVASWLLAAGQRGKLQTISQQWKFKLMQLSLFFLSVSALIALVATLPEGLLGSPDMNIVGGNSYSGSLSWYQDYSAKDFPQAWVISLPLWSYKVLMLLWSLWLASALMNWIRWVWQQLSVHALWTAPAEILTHTMLDTNITNDATPSKNS